MKRALFIAEKPSVARDCLAVYNKFGVEGYRIDFKSARGHLVELLYPAGQNPDWEKWNLDYLPMIPDVFKYQPIKRTQSVFDDIKKAVNSGKYDVLINACDSEIEGEAIFNTLMRFLKTDLPVMRFWNQSLSEEGIRKSFENLEPASLPKYVNLGAAADLRARFDWLLGMNYSRATSIVTNRKGCSIGRVMTPTLNIIVTRAEEIENFVPRDYWQINAEKGNLSPVLVTADWKHKVNFTEKEKAEKVLESLKGKPAKLVKVHKKEAKSYSSRLYSLAALQKDAFRAFGFSADKTLSIIQSLYEEHKVLTYPRTDSEYLPEDGAKLIEKSVAAAMTVPELVDHCYKILESKKSIKAYPANKRYVDDSKVSDHHAIIPTEKSPDFENMSKDEIAIYKMAATRLIATLMDPKRVSRTTYIFEVDKQPFLDQGEVLIDPGYTVLYPVLSNVKSALPELNEGEIVVFDDFLLNPLKTKAKSKMDEAALLEAMEHAGSYLDESKYTEAQLKEYKKALQISEGIGRPATRSGIIEKLITKGYVERVGSGNKSYYMPTEFGRWMIHTLSEYDFCSPALTAVWKSKLEQLVKGKYDFDVLYAEMKDYISNGTRQLVSDKKLKSGDIPVTEGSGYEQNNGKKIGQCPVCGEDVMLNSYGMFCSNKQNGSCDFFVGSTICNAKLSETNMKKLLSGKETTELKMKFNSGKKGSAKIKLKPDGKLNFIFQNSSSSGSKIGTCKCGGDVVDNGKCYKCTGCNFKLFKTMKGATVTKQDAIDFYSGGKTQPLDMVYDDEIRKLRVYMKSVGKGKFVLGFEKA